MTLHRFVAIVAATLISASSWPLPALAAPMVVPSPPREGGLTVPETPPVSADSWIVYDADAELVLASQAAEVPRPMASTTKMMTVLVALKHGDLTDRVRVSERAAGVGESEVGLMPGERLPLSMLITALVVRSANDAAMAVAEHIAGSVEEFVELMNEEAATLGLESTRFENPHGLDGEEHYSTAEDLLTLSLAVMDYPEYRERAVLTRSVFPPAPDGTERSLVSTNVMLETYPGTLGVKTGYTNEAGLVFAAAAERGGRTLFVVVMGSEGERGHFEDATALLDWGFERFRSVALVGAGSYEPSEPERVVQADEPEAPPEPEPVIVTNVRTSDVEPPELEEAWTWISRLVQQLSGA